MGIPQKSKTSYLLSTNFNSNLMPTSYAHALSGSENNHNNVFIIEILSKFFLNFTSIIKWHPCIHCWPFHLFCAWHYNCDLHGAACKPGFKDWTRKVTSLMNVKSLLGSKLKYSIVICTFYSKKYLQVNLFPV